MHSNTFLKWIKNNNLDIIARNHSKYFKNILLNSLNIKNEDLILIGDYGTHKRRVAPLLSAAYYFAAKKLNIKTNLIMQTPKTRDQPADQDVISTLKKQNESGVIILNLSNRIGKLIDIGKTFRRYIKARRHRFVSTSGVGSLDTEKFYSITKASDIDYLKLKKQAKRLKRELDWGREVKVITENGTDLEFNIIEQKAVINDGDYSLNGFGGNIPAGEIYIAPRPKRMNGKIVIDGSSRNREGTIIIKKPITLTIKKNEITKIKGCSEARLLSWSLSLSKLSENYKQNVRKIGEFGIGLNPKAKIIGAMIVDEKTYGTAHVGIGGNYWFGGNIYCKVHLDQVFNNPVICVDGKELKI